MINKAILIGNVGQEPETAVLSTGKKVSKLSLATSMKFRKGDEIVNQTIWHNIIAWGGLADVVEAYVKKGSKVYIEGHITYRNYEADGVKKYITEIIVENIRLLDKQQNKEFSKDNDNQIPF